MNNAIQNTGPDKLLAALSARVLDIVEYTLSNDEHSTDAEVGQYLMDLGLSETQAKRVLCYRALYSFNIYVGDRTPIRSNARLLYDGETN